MLAEFRDRLHHFLSELKKELYRKIVHFDIPLTLDHESDLLTSAGFIIEKAVDVPDGATIILARKGRVS